jgi:hypothetical protein
MLSSVPRDWNTINLPGKQFSQLCETPETDGNRCISPNFARIERNFPVIPLAGAILIQPFQVIIPFGANSSQAEKRPVKAPDKPPISRNLVFSIPQLLLSGNTP